MSGEYVYSDIMANCFSVVGIILIVVTLIVLLLIIFMLHRLRIASALIAETSRYFTFEIVWQVLLIFQDSFLFGKVSVWILRKFVSVAVLNFKNFWKYIKHYHPVTDLQGTKISESDMLLIFWTFFPSQQFNKMQKY